MWGRGAAGGLFPAGQLAFEKLPATVLVLMIQLIGGIGQRGDVAVHVVGWWTCKAVSERWMQGLATQLGRACGDVARHSMRQSSRFTQMLCSNVVEGL
jgi:hypothetical protein